MSKTAPVLLLTLMFCCRGPLFGQAPGETYVVSPAASKVKVDGLLNDAAWQKATVIKLPFEWTPGDNVPPPVETECLVTFDRDGFYIAFRCFDPEPKKIRAHLMDRDATDTLIQDDHVSVIIDAFNDERRGFQFRVNPLGVQADANFSELEGYEDFSWDAIWASAGKITEWGYAVEIGIPFNQLRFPRSLEKQTWGFSAERSWPRSVRHRMISHRQARDIACILCQFNKLSGLEGLSPGRNLEFDPTLTSSRTDEMDMGTQAQLLRVIGEREILPVGEARPREVQRGQRDREGLADLGDADVVERLRRDHVDRRDGIERRAVRDARAGDDDFGEFIVRSGRGGALREGRR